jgi:hypothetical protein
MASGDTPYDGLSQESFLIEVRSLGGFSGSPMFVTTTQGYEDANLPAVLRNQIQAARPMLRHRITRGRWGPWLLGIDWGHAPLWQPVYERVGNAQMNPSSYVTAENTGIAYVAPAWRIMGALNHEELIATRLREDEELIANRRRENAEDLGNV